MFQDSGEGSTTIPYGSTGQVSGKHRASVKSEDIVCSCMKVQAGVLTHRDSVTNYLDIKKGVICKIVPEDHMPVDSEGNRADIVIDPGSTVSRMNLGRLYEAYIGASARDTSKKIRSMLGIEQCKEYKALKQIKTLYESNPQLIDSIYNYLLNFYNIISEPQANFYSHLDIEKKLQHLAEIVAVGIYIYYPTDNQKESVDIIKELEQHYKPVYGPVSYIGNSGNRVITKSPVRIAPLYIMVLEKIADDWSAVSSGKLQHFGVLAPITKSEKHLKPWHNSPVRNIGETEARIYSGYCGTEVIAEMMDRSNNPTAHRYIVKNILNTDKPTKIKEAVDRNIIPIGGSKALQLFKHFVICQGWKPKYIRTRKK